VGFSGHHPAAACPVAKQNTNRIHRDIGPILDPAERLSAKSLFLLARPTGIEPVFPP
jgi:hypothetical protein